MRDGKIVVGYIGNGKATNRYHAPFALALPEMFAIKAIFARHVDHSAWAAIPDVDYVTDIDAVLGDPEIDVIEVTTPSPLHYEMAKKVLLAGKHCVVDKPFAASVAEGEELFDLAAERGVTVQCYQNRRFDSDFLTVKRVLETQRLGKVFEIVTTYDYYRPHMLEGVPYERVGGAVYGHATHSLDQLISLLGIPTRWRSVVRQLQGTGYAVDYFDFDLFYDEIDIRASARANYQMAALRPSFAVYGSKGSFIKFSKDAQERDLKHFYLPAGHDDFGLDLPEEWGTLVWYDDDDQRHEERVETVRSSYCGFYEALYETIAHGAPQLVKPDETLFQLECLEQSTEGLR